MYFMYLHNQLNMASEVLFLWMFVQSEEMVADVLVCLSLFPLPFSYTAGGVIHIDGVP